MGKTCACCEHIDYSVMYPSDPPQYKCELYGCIVYANGKCRKDDFVKKEGDMRKTLKDQTGVVLKFIGVILIIMLVTFMAALMGEIVADAKTKAPEPTITSICTKVNEPDGEWWNGNHLYNKKKGVMQFGWVRWRGHTYYCHYTDSKKYPRGSATRGEMKIRNGKFYAFRGADCRMITEDYYYRYGPVSKRLSLKMNEDKSVRYVYNTARIHRNWRYSTKEHRLQICGSDDIWRSVGMQYWPDYKDWQK